MATARGRSVINTALIEALARSGESQRTGLRLYREAGFRIRDSTFRAIWNRVPETERKKPRLALLDPDVIPGREHVVIVRPDEQGRTPGLKLNWLWRVTVRGIIPQTGLEGIIRLAFRSLGPLTKREVEAAVFARAQQVSPNDTFPMEITEIEHEAVFVREGHLRP
jgi:hypothetical protein